MAWKICPSSLCTYAHEIPGDKYVIGKEQSVNSSKLTKDEFLIKEIERKFDLKDLNEKFENTKKYMDWLDGLEQVIQLIQRKK